MLTLQVVLCLGLSVIVFAIEIESPNSTSLVQNQTNSRSARCKYQHTNCEYSTTSMTKNLNLCPTFEPVYENLCLSFNIWVSLLKVSSFFKIIFFFKLASSASSSCMIEKICSWVFVYFNSNWNCFRKTFKVHYKSY